MPLKIMSNLVSMGRMPFCRSLGCGAVVCLQLAFFTVYVKAPHLVLDPEYASIAERETAAGVEVSEGKGQLRFISRVMRGHALTPKGNRNETLHLVVPYTIQAID